MNRKIDFLSPPSGPASVLFSSVLPVIILQFIGLTLVIGFREIVPFPPCILGG